MVDDHTHQIRSFVRSDVIPAVREFCRLHDIGAGGHLELVAAFRQACTQLKELPTADHPFHVEVAGEFVDSLFDRCKLQLHRGVVSVMYASAADEPRPHPKEEILQRYSRNPVPAPLADAVEPADVPPPLTLQMLLRPHLPTTPPTPEQSDEWVLQRGGVVLVRGTVQELHEELVRLMGYQGLPLSDADDLPVVGTQAGETGVGEDALETGDILAQLGRLRVDTPSLKDALNSISKEWSFYGIKVDPIF